MITIKRVYLPPASNDGRRVLVDRLWPRGLTRDAAAIDEWLKAVAPSTDLRRWFDHDSARWVEFGIRYRKELAAPGVLAEVLRLRDLARTGTVTLLYAARNETENHAVVLRDFIRKAKKSL